MLYEVITVLFGQRIVLGFIEHDLEELHRLMIAPHHVYLPYVLSAEATVGGGRNNFV